MEHVGFRGFGRLGERVYGMESEVERYTGTRTANWEALW